MRITADRRAAFALIDALVERLKQGRFPYNLPEAILPQSVIPEELRAEKRALACFYFFACIYMRGGIESLQAFRALIRMHQEHPYLFDPYAAQWLAPEAVETTLRIYIGWDAKAAAINWVENARRLVRDWGGSPLNLLKGLRSYTEALRRIRNKRTKREQAAAGKGGAGFRGFQPKMVSMLLYFYDWERWLEKRFPYPSPADFHNFRLALNQGAIVIVTEEGFVRTSEKIARIWREFTFSYVRIRKEDPLVVADALWFFSLLMCGNSPVNATREGNGSGMFASDALPHIISIETYRLPRLRRALERTCLACPLLIGCRLAIPAQPYYRKGQLVLAPRPRVEEAYGALIDRVVI